MMYPSGSDFTVDDVIKSFQYQTPVSEFRTKYDYDNLLYIVAGEIIKRVSAKQWDRFVEEEILDKLGMGNSVGIYQNIRNNSNVAMPHKIENNEAKQVTTYTKKDGTMAASGGIHSSVKDMSKWVMMLLNKGAYGDSLEHRLISEKNHQELWKIRTLRFNDPYGNWVYNTHYSGYALGFFVQDQNGYTIIDHGGGTIGMLSKVTIIPELNAGIVVLSNSDSGGGLGYVALTNDIKDEIIGRKDLQWDGWAEMRMGKNKTEPDSVVNAVWKLVEKVKNTKLDFNSYNGAI